MITNFINNSTVIDATWLNKVDRTISEAIGNGTNNPTSPTEVKQNLGLDNVDNTSDADKPVSTAQSAAIGLKADTSTVNSQLALKSDIITTVVQDSSTGSGNIPAGTSAQRTGSPVVGATRFNTTLNGNETWNGSGWSLDLNSGSSDGQLAGFRNKLFNGNFDIWQRGTSFVNPASVYTADRWNAAGTNTTVTRVSGYSGVSTYACALTATNATNSGALAQTMESTQVMPLRGRTVTLSFSYSASVNQAAGSLTAKLQKSITADLHAAAWVDIAAATSFTPTTAPQRGVITLAVPNDGTALGLRTFFTTTNIGNGQLIYIFNVQLEEGSIATPFEQRPIGLELNLCQRYYEAGNFYSTGYVGAGAGQPLPSVQFKVPKRATPTMSNGTVSYYNSSALVWSISNYDMAVPTVTGASANVANASATYASSAEL